MTHVQLEHLSKVYPRAAIPAVNDVSIDIPPGQLVALLGPSGCGKTTTLKMIAGLIRPTAGRITFDGEDVLNVPTEKRGAVMVFQNYLLFPYMTVGENVGFGLKMRGTDKKLIQKRVQEMLELVQLPDITNRRPKQLSGGQQQRVSLARSLIVEPRVLLLDEPLSNLDAHLRDEMRELILKIQRELGVTTIFVTHDQEEAVLLADKIALIFEGELQQYASAVEFYQRPISARVSRFFGNLNFVPGTRTHDQLTTPFGNLRFEAEQASNAPQGAVLLTVRPEQIRLCETHDHNTFTGRVYERIYMGTYTRYKLMLGDNELEAIRSADLPGELNAGDEISVYIPPDRIWVVANERKDS